MIDPEGLPHRSCGDNAGEMLKEMCEQNDYTLLWDTLPLCAVFLNKTGLIVRSNLS